MINCDSVTHVLNVNSRDKLSLHTNVQYIGLYNIENRQLIKGIITMLREQ